MDQPRIYRLRRRYRYFYIGLGLFFALLAAGLGAWALSLAPGDDLRPWLLPMSAAWLLAGLLMMRVMQRFHYVLSDEAFERHGLFGVRRLFRDDIAGRRLIAGQHGPPITRLVSRSPRSPSISIHAQLETDAHLAAWLRSLPDADLEEQKQSLDEYLHREGGGSADEKRARLVAAHRTANTLNVLTAGLCAWAFFHPHPYELALGLVAALPILALVVAAWGGDAYSLNPRNNDVRAFLVLPLVGPGAVLLLRALFDVNLFDWRDGLWATLLVTSIFVALLWIFVRAERERKTSLFTLALLMTAYGYGVAALGNKVLDRSAPRVFPAQVLAMHVSSGKTTNYYLELAPWGPRASAEDVDAGRALYDRVRKGDTVCVYLYPGAFQMRWFEVWNCPD